MFALEQGALLPNLVRFGTFEVDLTAGELRKNGVKLKLTGQPFQVLAILLERPGQVVTREELQKKLTAHVLDVDRGLNATINRIREVLSDSAESRASWNASPGVATGLLRLSEVVKRQRRLTRRRSFRRRRVTLRRDVNCACDRESCATPL